MLFLVLGYWDTERVEQGMTIGVSDNWELITHRRVYE